MIKSKAMKQFEVHYTSHEVIEAETLQEAVGKFREKFPSPAVCPQNFYECGEGIDNHVIGFCETSELPIFEGDEYSTDGEVMWLKSEAEKES